MVQLARAFHPVASDLARRAPARTPSAQLLRPIGTLNAESILEIQRRAGNQVATQWLRSQGHEPVAVQRHSSWEHALIGDTKPQDLAQAVGEGDVNAGNREHLLREELRRMQFFHLDPTRDPTGEFPDIRWIQLKQSQLWLSYGELTALPDYLANPTYADYMDQESLIPVLQRLRQAIQDKVEDRLPRDDGFDAYGESPADAEPERQQGQADEGGVSGVVSAAAGEVNAVDAATAWLGSERHKAVLSRNACHFAPYSWERWRHFHNQARQLAAEYHRTDPWANTATPKGNVSAAGDGPGRDAVVNNGFGDHYLQDSFAAGHLANKTLIMQWFVQYLRDHTGEILMDFALLGAVAPDINVLESVPADVLESIPEQAGIGGRELYRRDAKDKTSVTDDRFARTDTTDPQSAEERSTREARMGGSGVAAGGGRSREQNYQAYLEFLNTTVVNLAAAAVHDWLNDRGLRVKNRSGTYEASIGGDGTMLALSDSQGAEVVAKASHDSADAIDQIMRTGTTSISTEQIFDLVPVTVVATPFGLHLEWSLEQFQDDVLHQLCDEHLFPDLVNSYKTAIVAVASPELVKGGASVDSPP
jgi:hypothetical protein